MPSDPTRTIGRVTWTAGERYGIGPAPGGLALVQDLLNTVGAGRPRERDLLADLVLADEWATAAMDAWSAGSGITVEPRGLAEDDVARLRDLRADLRSCMGASTASSREVLRTLTASVALHRDGRVVLAPRGEGWRPLATAVLLEIAAAQQVDSWRRLKLCRNTRCAVAFFDRSKNCSGVWHDVRVCGNAVNLRASRARRGALANGRAADGDGAAVEP